MVQRSETLANKLGCFRTSSSFCKNALWSKFRCFHVLLLSIMSVRPLFGCGDAFWPTIVRSNHPEEASFLAGLPLPPFHLILSCGPEVNPYKDLQGKGALKRAPKLPIRVRPWNTGCTGGNSLSWKSGPESNLRPPQIVPKSVCLSTSPSDLTEQSRSPSSMIAHPTSPLSNNIRHRDSFLLFSL